jgi:hypothetical protein
MSYYFGKKVAKPLALPSPDDVAASAFGRFVRYGVRKTQFGRQYFGSRYPQFGKRRRAMMFGAGSCGAKPMNSFGRRRKGVRKSVRKAHKKPPARLMKMCRKHKIKCTKKVGKHRVYKSVAVLKKQLRKRMKSRKSRKVVRRGRKGVRRTRRRTHRRVSLFGFKF